MNAAIPISSSRSSPLHIYSHLMWSVSEDMTRKGARLRTPDAYSTGYSTGSPNPCQPATKARTILLDNDKLLTMRQLRVSLLACGVIAATVERLSSVETEPMTIGGCRDLHICARHCKPRSQERTSDTDTESEFESESCPGPPSATTATSRTIFASIGP